MTEQDKKVIVILGPTASGKTSSGVGLADKFSGEIISADSRQVYCGMDIGTGKDLAEYKIGDKNIPYHLIDVVDPSANFNVAKYQKQVYAAIKDIQKRGKLPIIVGGTGLYISAVTEGYQFVETKDSSKEKVRADLDKLSLNKLLQRLEKLDPHTFDSANKNNRRHIQRALEIYYLTGGRPKSEIEQKIKPDLEFLKIGINYPKEILTERIDIRLKERLEKEGMIDEVKDLHRQGVSWDRLDSFGLEYRWLARYLQEKISYDEMAENLSRDIKHFAKRQMTWFRRDKDIKWINEYKKIEKEVKDFLG